MILEKILFYLDKNQGHGQSDEFLRHFLLKSNLCRPFENLDSWQLEYYFQKRIIRISNLLKNRIIYIFQKSESNNFDYRNDRMGFLNKKIDDWREKNINRGRLIFLEVIDNDKAETSSSYLLLENRNIVELLEWRSSVEIKQWMDVCLTNLEDENWFKSN